MDDQPARSRRPGSDTAVRLGCHVAAWLPLVVVGFRSLATGWLPTSDAAVSAWRARDVLSAHPTLLGAPTHTSAVGHQAFAPGPVLSWLLTVPVHLAPGPGVLWGSVLLALAAASLAVEAGRAAWSPWGGVLTAASVFGLLATEPGIVFNPVWTPWLGAVWTVAALACAWAVGSGRWLWWPGSVAASSVAAQSHVIFVPVALGVCAAGPVAALLAHRSGGGSGGGTAGRSVRWRALVAGGALGLVLWLPTLIDQVTGRPGNLTLLWRGARGRGGTLGLSLALRGYGSATAPAASWMHRLPTRGTPAFIAIYATVFDAAVWQGVATLALLVVVAAAAVRTGRNRLAAAAWIALVAGAAVTVTVAAVPQSDVLELGYVSVVYWPVGMLAWAVLVAGTVELARVASARTGHRLAVPARVAGAVVALVLVGSVALAATDVAGVPDELSVGGGPAAVTIVRRSTAAVLAVAPRRPFELVVVGPDPARLFAVLPGLGYALAARGAPVRLPPDLAAGIAARDGAAPGMATVTVTVPADLHPTVRVTPGSVPSGRRRHA